MSISTQEVINAFNEWRDRDEDDYYDFISELAYSATKGKVMQFPAGVFPSGYTVTIEDEDVELVRDSYGYPINENANYIVFKFEDASLGSELFKLTGGYSSYEGWEWNISDIKQVESKPKTVYTWEEV